MHEYLIPNPRPLNLTKPTASVERLIRRVFVSLADGIDHYGHKREPVDSETTEIFVATVLGARWPFGRKLKILPSKRELDALFDAPDVSDRICVRFAGTLATHNAFNIPSIFDAMHARRPIDLDGLAYLLGEMGVPERELTDRILKDGDYHFRYSTNEPFTGSWPDADVWPFFARRPKEFARVVDVLNKGDITIWPGTAIEIIGRFPHPPKETLDALYENALGKGKRFRSVAQKTLARDPNRDDTVRRSLAHKSPEVRTNAARWLGEIGGDAAHEALLRAAETEKNAAARTALYDAVASFDTVLDTYVSDGALLAEASAGLKNGVPADLAWFPWQRLPTVRDSTGVTVAEDILKWLIVSACRLRSPEPTELLRTHVAGFDASDRATFGRFVLDEWIAYDTVPVRPSEADRLARASARANYVRQERYTEEELYGKVLPRCAEEPVGSAIKSKGILAVAAACCDGAAVEPISAYLKRWYGMRPSHGKTLIVVLAWIDDARAAQALFSIADRFRTKSFQDEARREIASLAVRKGWSVDELADRTVPTGGFEETGSLELSYGDPSLGAPSFTVKLGDDLQIGLYDAEGKAIAALPKALTTERDVDVKSASARLSAAKKSVKAIVAAQTARFHESLCSNRRWTFADFERYLLGHPIVSRLASRLVWMTEPNDRETCPTTTFRPTLSGVLVDVNEDPVFVDPETSISLAHDLRIAENEASAWQKHFSEHAVPALLRQFGTNPFELPRFRADSEELGNFVGFMIEGHALRNATKKRDWARGDNHYANCFFSYEKRFSTLGIQAVISFTGNEVPEKDLRTALKTLYFEKLDGSKRFNLSRIALGDVPPILLSETFNDVRYFAAAGSGFKPNWETEVSGGEL